MRKIFIEGIFQDIKGYFENQTNGKIEIMYENYDLANHEFGFKMHVNKTPKCSKQMFNEACSAIVNTFTYMFRGDSEQYDMSFMTEDDKLDIEWVSNW